MGQKTIRSYKNPKHKSRKAIWPEAQMWMIFKWYIKRQQRKDCSISAVLPKHLIYIFTGPRLTHWVSSSAVQSKDLIKSRSAPQNNTCCIQPSKTQTQVIGVALVWPINSQRDTPAFAIVNKSTLSAKHFPPVARALIQSYCWRLSSLLAKLNRFVQFNRQ